MSGSDDESADSRKQEMDSESDQSSGGEEKPKKEKKKKDKKKKDKKEKKEKKEPKEKKEKKEKDEKKKDKKEPKEKKEKKDKEKKKDKEDKEKKKDKKKKDKKEKKKEEVVEEDSGEEEVEEQEEVEPVAVKVVKPQAPDSSDDDSDAGSEAARMQLLLSNWDDDDEKGSDDSSDDSDDDSDDEEDAPIIWEIDLKYNVLDHVVLAAPDFVEAVTEFEKMTGIKPEVVGSLRGMGTKSARVGLDNNCYLEILAPDPKNAGPLTAQLKSLEEGTLTPFHYAIRRDDIIDLKDNYIPNELGWDPDHIAMGGASSDGTPKRWQMCFMHGHKLGGIVPFYIDWDECEHPTARIPEVGNLKRFTVRAPGGHKIHALLEDVGYVSTEVGEPKLEFAFGSPEGTITFSGDYPPGLKFPGFEEAKEANEASEAAPEEEESDEEEEESDEEEEESEEEDESEEE